MMGAFEQMTMSDGAAIAVYHAQPEGARLFNGRYGLEVIDAVRPGTRYLFRGLRRRRRLSFMSLQSLPFA